MELNSDREQNDTKLHHFINEFYKDSDDESTEVDTKATNSTFVVKKRSAFIRNFKPFELEKSFAMADRPPTHGIKQNIVNVMTDTEGFLTCLTMNKSELKTVKCKTGSEERNSSFVITESELINCCNQAEEVLDTGHQWEQNNVILEEDKLAPDKNENLVLVNSILQDFSQSPLKERQVIEKTFWEYTPEFRMRKQPVKTYSRKFLNSTKTNLSQRFGAHATKESSENIDEHSSCSSLSVQEDVALAGNLNSKSAITNSSNSQHLCENLLSDYYTENQSPQSLSDEQQMEEANDSCLLPNSQENVSVLHNIQDLLNHILTLRSIYPPTMIRHDSCDSLDDFHGFDCKENMMDDENTAVKITNRSLNRIQDVKICNNRLSNTLIQQEDDWNEDECHDIFAGINTESLLQQYNGVQHAMRKSPKRNGYVRDHQISVEIAASSHITGFKTASSKSIKVSREAQLVAAQILSNLPEIPEFEETKNCDKKTISEDNNVFGNHEDYEWNDDCDLFLNFQTPIALEDNSEKTFEVEPNYLENQPGLDAPSTSKCTTLGFTTAGGKHVHISSTAQKAVRKILNEFASDLENDYNYEEELGEIKRKIYAKTHDIQKERSSLSAIKKPNTHHGIQMIAGKNITIANQENVRKLPNEIGKVINKAPQEVEPLNSPTSCNNKFDVNVGSQNNNSKYPNEDYLNDAISNKCDVIRKTHKVEDKDKKAEFLKASTNKDLQTKLVQRDNVSPKARIGIINLKRKSSIDNSDLESDIRTPPNKILKYGLNSSKSSFAEQILRSPLTSAKPSAILRKNLSLTKHPKIKRSSLAVPTEGMPKTSKEKRDLKLSLGTAIKESTLLPVDAQTASTPNLKEFFSNAAQTSTPQIIKTGKRRQTLEDSDLKPITWNNTNEDSFDDKSQNMSTRTTENHSETCALNTTFNSSNPTAKERIGRLKMYGEAPAVSPILIETNHSCRPSGLRRTRSMAKKSET